MESITSGLANSHYVDNPFGNFAIRDNCAKLAKQEGPILHWVSYDIWRLFSLCAHKPNASPSDDHARRMSY